MSPTMESIISHMEYKRTVLAVAMITCLILFWRSQPRETNNEEQIEQKSETNAIKRPNYNDRMLEVRGVCYDMHIFLQKPTKIAQNNLKQEEESSPDKTVYLKKHGVNETSLIAVMLGLLIVSTIISLADVLKVKREQSNNSSADSDMSERCSLAEFANMKRPRRESSIGGVGSSSRRDSTRSGFGVAQLCRFESVGTAFSRMRRESISATGASVLAGTETPTTPPAGIIRTPLKLLGARPAPMLRRSSFPAVSLLDGNDRRRLSVDSEDDSSPDTGLGRRRIRIIRRH